MSHHTPGPWRWKVNLKHNQVQLCGGVPRFDVTVMDFVRWGMGGAAPRFNADIRPNINLMKRVEEFAAVQPGREHHADWFQRINHPDARLIEAAPDLLAACHVALERIESDVGPSCREAAILRAAIAKTAECTEPLRV